MENDFRLNPLANDPGREAVAPMRGYSYQILRSIETWLDLADGEELYLEGAEDLDRARHSEVTTEQVKDTKGSGTLTLRNGNAIAAISNFWQHCKRNPGSTIKFRYLTTSEVGMERGTDLSLSRPGVEAWEQIRRAPNAESSLADAEIIKNFLVSHDGTTESLKDFLTSATTEQFVDRVILPFEWVTGQPNADALQQRIENKLIELGEPRKISATSSSGALADLHLHAWNNVIDPTRAPLRRGDFIRILEAAGSTTIPTSQLLDLMMQLTGGSAPANEIAPLLQAIAKPPLAIRGQFSRPELEEKISAALRVGTVLIHGSTGMGKTILASAALKGFTGAGWIDLRDLTAASIVAILDAATQHIIRQRSPMTIVLDDLDANGDTRATSPALGRLMAAIREVSGFLLITSSQKLPPRLATMVILDEDRILAAPAFDTDEIGSFLGELGCPADDIDVWSKIVSMSTSGHPQLVNARLQALQRQDWPRPSIAEWLTPTSELVDVRAEARQIVSALPQDERELLARASLVLGRISRRRLMAVGGIAPALPEPGLTIDRLTGPWLEVTDTSDLRVSPLLRNLGVEIRGAAWSKGMHGNIAWAWLDRSMSPADVSTILMHSILNGSAGPLFHILPSLLEAPPEVWKQIGEAAGAFAMIGVEDQYESPFPGTLDTGVLRLLQLRMAMEGEADQLRAVVGRALREADNRRSGDLGTVFFDFMFVWQLLARDDLVQPVSAAIDLGLRFKRLAEDVRQVLTGMDEEGRKVVDVWPDFSPIVSFSLIRSTSTIEKFSEYLDLVDGLDPTERRYLLPGRFMELDSAIVVLNQIWLDETQSGEPDWAGLAELLERTRKIALREQILPLASAAAALLVRVIDEDLRDSTSAIATADRTLAGLGDHGTRLLAAKAKVLWRSGALPEALAVYDQIIPDLDVLPPFRADIFREGALTAARAKLWQLAAQRFGDAVADLGEDDQIERHVGFRFDYGLALYLAGQTNEALTAFGEAVQRLLDDGRPSPPEPLLSVRQLGSHALKIVLADLKGEPRGGLNDPEAFLGNASAIDTLKWGDQRPASTALVASQLLEVLLFVPGDLSAAMNIAEWLRGSKDGLVLATGFENFSRLAVLTGVVSPLIADTVRQMTYLAHLSAQHAAGHGFHLSAADNPPTPPLSNETEVFYTFTIFLAIIVLMANGKVSDLPFGSWKADLPPDPTYNRLCDFLTDAEKIMLGQDDPWAKITGENSSWPTHALIALGAIARKRTPGELLTAQSLAAHYMNQPMLKDLTGAPLSELIAATWLALCAVPALLATPRISVPAIQSAASSKAGWPKIKAILEAALLAVPSEVARNVRPHIAKLSAT
ncbi:hypothetical protein [Pararhizobium sp. DWP3-4]|uniref:hypothetical protein n=1 Tax=Pararhizobium sp. DWP3-4 TaxID=2804565 RepID=UPI003CF340D8